MMWLDVAEVALGLLLIFLVLNALAWLVFRAWPSLLLSENQRLTLEHWRRYDKELRPYLFEWFDVRENEWWIFTREFRFQDPGSHIYEPYVEHRHPPQTGRFVNVHPAGFRHVAEQGPWPPSPSNFNIFFFGGSTTLHVGPDWTSIPSYLQQALNGGKAISRPIRVYNFGRGSYISIQERILFQQLLLSRLVPDIAIFLDGLNDFYFFDGRPSIGGFFGHALDQHNLESSETLKSRTGAVPKWQKLREFAESLPLSRAIEVVGTALFKRGASADEVLYKPIPVAPELLLVATERYLENKRQIEAICRDRRIKVLFVWQPVPAYKYDLQHHAALSAQFGLGGHERSGPGYTIMAKRLEAQPPGENFLWLADIQESEKQPLYLDNVHYTCGFSRTIAGHIADALFVRGFIPGKTRAPS